jgi:hypothetical protein
MKRKSFFKSIITLAIAPKILADIDFVKSTSAPVVGSTSNLFADLQLLKPVYYKQFKEMVKLMNDIRIPPEVENVISQLR